MQKHLLALAAGVATLAFSTGAYAQSNKAYTGQQDNNNTITINQSGRDGFAGFSTGERLDQRGGGNNRLDVRQGGNGNVVGATDYYNTGLRQLDGAQNGNSNTLRIDQSGSNNGVRYSQFGDNNGNLGAGASNGANGAGPYGGSGSQSPVGGGNGYGGATETSLWNFVRQSGNGDQLAIKQDSQGVVGTNGVISRQNSTNSKINLDQKATNQGNNYAYFNQNGGENNTISLGQVNSGAGGDFNLADIRQADGYVGREASSSAVTSTQNGYRLDLFINQSGSKNTANTDQSVGSNTMSIFQSEFGAGGRSGNTINASQLGGTGNYLYSFQNGNGNEVKNTQNASNNTSLVEQTFYRNFVDSSQTGTNHRLDVQQINGSGLNDNRINSTQTGNQQDLFVRQNGYGLTVESTQSNSLNMASVRQDGFENRVINVQSGTLNDLQAIQNGSNLKIDSTQSGTSAIASVNQTGDNNTYIGNQSGTSNKAYVMQGASGNIANVAQAGTLNVATITQNR